MGLARVRVRVRVRVTVEQLGEHLSVTLGAGQPTERVDRRQAHLRAKQEVRLAAGQLEPTCQLAEAG